MKSLAIMLKAPACFAMALFLSSCALQGAPGTIKEDRLQYEITALDSVAEDLCALIKERHALARDNLYLVSQSSFGQNDNQGLKDIEDALKQSRACKAGSFESGGNPSGQVKIYETKDKVADDLSLKIKASPVNASDESAQGGDIACQKSSRSSGPASLFDMRPSFKLEDLLVYALKDKLALEGAALCSVPDKCQGQTLIVGLTDTGSQILVFIDDGSSSIYRLYQKSSDSYLPASQFSIIAKEG